MRKYSWDDQIENQICQSQKTPYDDSFCLHTFNILLFCIRTMKSFKETPLLSSTHSLSSSKLSYFFLTDFSRPFNCRRASQISAMTSVFSPNAFNVSHNSTGFRVGFVFFFRLLPPLPPLLILACSLCQFFPPLFSLVDASIKSS